MKYEEIFGDPMVDLPPATAPGGAVNGLSSGEAERYFSEVFSGVFL